jgi:hypothetical protein
VIAARSKQTDHRANSTLLMCVNNASEKAPSTAGTKPSVAGSIEMLDIIMLAIGLGFFALSIGYAYACDWL